MNQFEITTDEFDTMMTNKQKKIMLLQATFIMIENIMYRMDYCSDEYFHYRDDELEDGNEYSMVYEDIDLHAPYTKLYGIKEIEVPHTTEVLWDGLSDAGITACMTIMNALPESLDTGGCRTFYTPKEWEERGELFCTDAELIVVFDGGDVAPYFNMSYCQMDLVEKMQTALEKVGMYYEYGMSWYCGIYLSDKGE